MTDITSQIRGVGTMGYIPLKAIYTDPSTNVPMIVNLDMYYNHGADPSEQARLLNRLIRQLSIWSKMMHPNIVPLIGRCTATERNIQCLVYPFYENGSISNYLHARGEASSEAVRLSMIIDVAKAVQFIHAHDVVHGEIDIVHVFIDADGKALLHGFARAKVIGHAGQTTEAPNGILKQFIAPELFAAKNNSQLTKEADVYSFGLIALYILSRSLPYARRTPYEMESRLVQVSDYPDVNPRLWQILSHCISYSPESRITIAEALSYLQQAADHTSVQANTEPGTLSCLD